MYLFVNFVSGFGNLCRDGNRGDKKRAKEAAFLRSLHAFLNPWRNMPTGVNDGLGYFGLIWPEVMHHVESGLMKIACECIVKMMQRHGVGR